MLDARCVILAGGLGTRLNGANLDLPIQKAMVPVNNQPVIHHVLDWVYFLGVKKVTVCAWYQASVVTTYLDSLNYEGMRIETVVEPRLCGTAGALFHAKKQILDGDEPAVLVLNADTLVCALPEIVREMVGYAVQRPVGIVEVANMDYTVGFRVFNRNSIARLDGSFMGQNIESLSELQNSLFDKMMVCTSDINFLDIGTPETLALADVFAARIHEKRYAWRPTRFTVNKIINPKETH